jgi:hypothetical protein
LHIIYLIIVSYCVCVCVCVYIYIYIYSEEEGCFKGDSFIIRKMMALNFVDT